MKTNFLMVLVACSLVAGTYMVAASCHSGHSQCTGGLVCDDPGKTCATGCYCVELAKGCRCGKVVA
jgi:hypothetical protein